MARLSSPIATLKPHYDVVVVGSGYGGAIAACRLAQAGRQVCVLERGRELQPGEYPDTTTEVLREVQFDFPTGHIGQHTGLYDLRINDDISVFVGCGLGGTSLINANVALFADPDIFGDRWPKEFRPHGFELLPGLSRAVEMLEPTAYPFHLPPLLKLQALEKAHKQLQVQTPLSRLPINVTFEDRKNRAGVQQHACKLCGDCVSGCNYGAKNTLIMNYLPSAKNDRAEIYTRVAVRYVQPRDDGRWSVHYQLLDAGREKFDEGTMFLTADVVVLAAGTLGSTEILLRSREKGLEVSDKLGCGFSANGDFLGLGYNGDEPIQGIGLGHHQGQPDESPVGPTTTGVIDLLAKEGFLIEEGTIPGAISALFTAGLAVAATLIGEGPDRGLEAAVKEKARRLWSVMHGASSGAIRNTLTYLVMGYDDAAGHMCLENDRLRVSWPGVEKQQVFEHAQDLLRKANEPFRGTYVDNLRRLVTVHPLGGCRMADDVHHGVVNHEGAVFSRTTGEPLRGLYVCDGSVVPRSLGVNPLLTISAIAERTSARLINTLRLQGP